MRKLEEGKEREGMRKQAQRVWRAYQVSNQLEVTEPVSGIGRT